MRSAGNFHPEWGYLAPAPSFMRTLRIALVATAIGATAGAAVVVSLVARPASGSAESSIAAHALVTGAPVVKSASAAVAPAAAQAAAIPAPPAAAIPQQAGASGETAGASKNPSDAAPPPQIASAPNLPVGAAALQAARIEGPAAAPVGEDAAVAPDGGANKKPAVKKHRVAGYETFRRWQSKKPRRGGNGFAPLFRLFSSRSGSPFSAN